MAHHVTFVGRVGDEPKGKGWDDFMEGQREALKAYDEGGWSLVSAVPVTTLYAGGSTLRGVLLYFVTKD